MDAVTKHVATATVEVIEAFARSVDEGEAYVTGLTDVQARSLLRSVTYSTACLAAVMERQYGIPVADMLEHAEVFARRAFMGLVSDE